MDLPRWIDSRHLDDTAAARARFEGDRFSSLVLDHFLLPERLAGLRACFGMDGAFRDHYGLIDRYDSTGATFAEQAVNAETFAAAPDAGRLAREQVLAGPAPGRELSTGWGTYQRWTMLLRSMAFHAWLAQVTGVSGITAIDHMPRIMRRGDFCRPHDDAGGGRLLCMLLYIDPDWRPGFGGRFQQMAGSEVARSIAPIGNRVILHRPAVELIHQVEAFAPEAAEWQRWTHSIWFLG